MHLRQRFVYVASACVMLFICIVLLNIEAQEPKQPQIAFNTMRDGNLEIYVMDADGRNPRRLTARNIQDGCPEWSPDGQSIVFHRLWNGKLAIHVMEADGNNQRRLTDNPADDCWPSWSPDGQSITFVSSRNGNEEVYVMDADGQNQSNLTNHPNIDNGPNWFDPAYAYAVSSAGKLRGTWGWIKQNSE